MTLQLDSNQLKLKRSTSIEYSIEWWMYKSKSLAVPKEIAKEDKARHFANICFSDLRSLGSNHGYNIIAYRPKRHQLLTAEQALRWVEVSVKWKMLPSHIKPAHLDSWGVIDFSDIPPSLLYLYLCQLRHLCEWPDLVRIALYLHDEHKVNFYLAIGVASKLGIFNHWHNYIQDSNDNMEPVRVSIQKAIGLRRFLQNPKQYDKRTCSFSEYFKATETIAATVSSLESCVVRVESLDDPNVVAAIEATTNEEAAKCIAKVLKKTA